MRQRASLGQKPTECSDRLIGRVPLLAVGAEGGIDVRKLAAVAAIVTLGMLVLASGTGATGGKGKSKHREDVIKLVATEIDSAFVDHGAPGPSLGDDFVFAERLRKDRRDAGTSGGVCTVTEVVPPYTVATFHCVATLALRRGQITLQGLVELQSEDDPGPFTVAITGGTGAYRGASGEAVIRDVSDTVTIYKLRLDSDKKKRH
jgi:allene oxide cyclase-like protein